MDEAPTAWMDKVFVSLKRSGFAHVSNDKIDATKGMREAVTRFAKDFGLTIQISLYNTTLIEPKKTQKKNDPWNEPLKKQQR